MRRRSVLALLLAFVSQASLAGQPKPISDAIAKKYAKTLGCAAAVATPIPGSFRHVGSVNIYDYEVKGCGQFLIADGFAIMGSVVTFDDLTIRRRAPIETNCPADQVRVDYLDPKTRIATGCGVRVTYMFVGEADNPGSWTANVIQSPAAVAPTPAPTAPTPAPSETPPAK